MNIYLAPMEGITGSIVRNAFFHQFGSIDKYFTPFIPAAKRLSRKILRDIAPEHNQGIVLIPQLISNQSMEILAMIEQLKDHGFFEFNINLGCPSGTVVSKKRGSGMLLYPEELNRFLDEIFQKADVPVSVKTRIGFNDLEEWPRILEIYSHYPVRELIIHPRLRRELYSGLPHFDSYGQAYQLYQEFGRSKRTINQSGKEFLPEVLCYNGDIWDIEHYQDIIRRFPETDTVMIGRGLLARPDLACRIKGISFPDTRARLRAFVNEIHDGYQEIFGNEKDTAMHMKEIWTHLGRSFQDSDRLIRKLMKCQTADQYQMLVSQIFETLALTPQ